jgi:CRP/FNR family transcriptional regulator, anaerobic regulatory protein
LLICFYKRTSSVGLGEAGRVPFPLTQQHISDAIGWSLIHTHRTLRQLHAMGLYALQDGWLSLPKPQVLERLAEQFDALLPARPLI